MADLNALIAQGAQFQAPTDPFAQYAKFQQLQQGQQANQLNLMKMQEYQRGLEEQNALRTRVSQPGFDVMNPEHQAQLMGVAPSLAPTYIEKALTTRKTVGEINKSDFDLQKSKYEHGIKTLGAADTPDKAIAAVDDAVAKGYFDKAAGDAEKAKIATAASAGQYEQYRTSMLTGLLDAKDQLQFKQPKPEQVKRADGSIVFLDQNPNSPTFGKEIMPQQAAGMTPYERGHLATQQRQAATAEARLAFEKANPNLEIKEQADGSLIGIDKRTGAARPITLNGQAVSGAGKPLTEGQGAAVAYGMRMAESDKLLRDLEGQGLKDTGKIRAGVSGAVGAIPLIGESLGKGMDNVFNVLPSIMGGLSEAQQQTMQARVNFITAVLRKESGASISPSEFATAEKNYFPAPGDSQAVVQQKQKARETAIKAMKVQAGPGAAEIDKHVGGGSAPAIKAPAAGTVQDGYRFKGGDPSVQANWEKL